jgi:hypothetical protein
MRSRSRSRGDEDVIKTSFIYIAQRRRMLTVSSMKRWLVLAAVFVGRGDVMATPADDVDDGDVSDPEDPNDTLPDVAPVTTHGNGAALLAEANRMPRGSPRELEP